MKMLVSLLALFLSVSGTARCTEYFPMHEGDVWYFSSYPKWYIGGTEDVNGLTYHRVYATPESFRLYRSDDAGNVYVVGSKGEESIIYKFQANMDDTWQYYSDGEHYEVSFFSKNATIKTPAGIFENCIGISFDADSYDANYTYWFAPDVGLISVFSRDISYDVQKAKVNGQKYPDRGVPLQVTGSLPDSRQRDIQPDMTVRISLNYAIPQALITPDLIRVVSQTVGVIDGTNLSPSGSTLSFTHDNPFPYNDIITVTLAPDIYDYCGDTLENSFSFTFTVRPQFYDPPSFTCLPPLELDATIPVKYALGDFDNDGDADMVVTGQPNSSIATQLLENSSGIFIKKDSSLSSVRPTTYGRNAIVQWIDYNHDNWIDLVYGEMEPSHSRMIRFFKNNRGELESDDSQSVMNYYYMQWCDYDHDNYPDLAVIEMNTSGNLYLVLYHNDSGILGKIHSINLQNYHPLYYFIPPKIQWIGTGETTPARIVAYLDDMVTYSIQNGRLQESGSFRPEDYSPVTVDFDLAEIPVHEWDQFTVDSTVMVSARGYLVFKQDLGEYINPVSVTLTDLDQDNDPDLLVGGEKRVGDNDIFMFIQIYKNNNGQFSLVKTYNLETYIYLREGRWADLDLDGDTDLVLLCNDQIINVRNEGFVLTGISSEPVPSQVSLSAHPNPFNGTIAISYTLASDTPAECAIYSLSGQKVYEFKSMPHTPGMNVLRWDGSDMEGRLVASGLYFLRLRQGNTLVHAKITYVK